MIDYREQPPDLMMDFTTGDLGQWEDFIPTSLSFRRPSLIFGERQSDSMQYMPPHPLFG